MLIAPPTDAASMSGVSAFVTSTLSNIEIFDVSVNRNVRAVPATAFDTGTPSIVTVLNSGDTPRMLT